MSAGFPESLKDINEIKEDPASDKLLKPSATTATLLKIVPAANFPTKRNMFAIIPTIPENFPYASFLSVSSFISVFLNKRFIIPSILFSLFQINFRITVVYIQPFRRCLQSVDDLLHRYILFRFLLF